MCDAPCHENIDDQEGVKRLKSVSNEENVELYSQKAEVMEKETPLENRNLVAAPVVFVDQYHVVKHILEYLKISDLLCAGLVNKQWSTIARIVRKQRKNLPFTALIHPYLPHHKLAFEYYNGFQVSAEAKDLVESRNARNQKPKRFIGLLCDAKSILRNSFMNSFDEPQLIVSFGTSSFDGHLIDEHGAQHRKVSKERLKLILGGIQDHIPSLTSFSCGAIACVPEHNIKSLEMEKAKFPCLSCLAVPKVPGLMTKIFTITKEQSKLLKGNESAEKCKSLLGIDDSIEDSLKGIMLLHKTTHRVSPVVESVLQYLRLNPHVALAGGVHDSVLASGVADDTILAAGVLFFGSPSVRVSSVALEEPEFSENTSNMRKLNKLKSTVLPGEKSFAFMFACNGRGRRMHGRPNVESDLFNSLFPNIPMVGAFTYGEFCNETIISGDEENSSRSPPTNIDFAYTTVFLLVSYKHPIDTQENTSRL